VTFLLGETLSVKLLQIQSSFLSVFVCWINLSVCVLFLRQVRYTTKTKSQGWVEEMVASQSLTSSSTYHHQGWTREWSPQAGRQQCHQHPLQAHVCRRRWARMTLSDTLAALRLHQCCLWDAQGASCMWCSLRMTLNAPNARVHGCLISSMITTPPPPPSWRQGRARVVLAPLLASSATIN